MSLNLAACNPTFTEEELDHLTITLADPVLLKFLESRLLATFVFIQGTPVPTSSADQREVLVSDTLICKGALQYFDSITQGVVK